MSYGIPRNCGNPGKFAYSYYKSKLNYKLEKKSKLNYKLEKEKETAIGLSIAGNFELEAR
jgi:hypothetical protein